MLNTKYDPVRGLHIPGTNTCISLGWLRTPEQFARECLTLKLLPQFNAWALLTQMPDDIVAQLESPLAPNATALAVMTSRLGVNYPVVVVQSAGLQLRLMLTLVNAATEQWLRAVQSECAIYIALRVPERNQLAVLAMGCELPSGLDVEQVIRECAKPDEEAFLRDASVVARQLEDAAEIPSLLPEFNVSEVRLVLVQESEDEPEPDRAPATARVLN